MHPLTKNLTQQNDAYENLHNLTILLTFCTYFFKLINQKIIQTLTKIEVVEFKHFSQIKKGFLVMNRHKLKAFLTIAFASNWTNTLAIRFNKTNGRSCGRAFAIIRVIIKM